MKNKISIDKKLLVEIFIAYGKNDIERFKEIGKEIATLFYYNGDTELALHILAQLGLINSWSVDEREMKQLTKDEKIL